MYKNYTLVLVFFIISIILILSAINLTEWLYSPMKFNVFKYVFRSSLLIAALYFFWKSLLKIANFVKSNLLKNITASIGSFFSIILFLEIILSFVPISSGGESNLFSKNWFNFYWEENELGYRDEDPKTNDNIDKKNLFFIGDSFIAGHGIKKSERMTNLLRAKFDNCVDVFNIAVCGADTKDKLKFLTTYPIKPDLIIASHHRNDIERVLSKREIKDILDFNIKSEFKNFKHSTNYLFKHSFLLNFIDFLIAEKKKIRYYESLQTKSSNIEDFMSSGEIGNALKLSYYKNDFLLDLHFKDLKKIVNYSKDIDVPIVFLLFTDLRELGVDVTNEIVNKPITQYLESLGIYVINTIDVIESIKEKERIVNKFDSHPSVVLNKKLADLVADELVLMGVYDKVCR